MSRLETIRERLDAVCEDHGAHATIEISAHTESMWDAKVTIILADQQWPERGYSSNVAGGQTPEAILDVAAKDAIQWLQYRANTGG